MEKYQSLKENLKENFRELSGMKREEAKNDSLLLSLLPPLVNASLKDTEREDKDNTLPALTKEMLQSDPHNFATHAINLMAMAVLERGNITLTDYECIIESAKILLGEEVLHARFQASIHAALLVDYYKEPQVITEQLQNFAKFLTEDETEHKVSTAQLDTLYTILEDLTLKEQREKYNIPSRFFQEVKLIFMEYKVEKQRAQLYSQQVKEGEGYAKNEEYEEKFFKLPSIFSYFNAKENIKKTKDKFNFFKHFPVKSPFATGLSTLDEFKDTIYPKLSGLEKFALSFQSTELLEQIRTFRTLLIPQDFRIVVLGEGKRGKTSLINALLGTSLLPTRAILPETGTLIEISYGQEPSYTVEWLNSEELDKLKVLLQEEEANLLLHKKMEDIKKILEDPQFSKDIQVPTHGKGTEIQEYISVDGLYTTFVKRVKISLSLAQLPEGMKLIDTPALNAADPFYNYLALEECLKADCLIFVLDARRPDSFSELHLLRQLAKHGRAIKLIGVLTHPSENQQERELARKRAFEYLQEGVRNVEGLEIADVLLINPSLVLSHFEASKKIFSEKKNEFVDKEYEKLLALLTKIISQGTTNKAYLNRIESTFNNLWASAQKICKNTLEEYRKTLPTPQHLELLQRHQEHLAAATKSNSQHAHSLILSVAHEIEDWRIRRNQAIEILEERLVLHITNSMHRFADSLGTNFAKESAWEPFDKEDAPRITQNLLDEFMAEQRADLRSWEEKIQLFTHELRELSVLCLNETQKSALALNSICLTHSKVDHFLVQTGSYMQKITLFVTGAGSGFLASSGIVNILALGGATIALITNPLIIPSALVLGATAFALRSFTNPVRRKKGLLTRKEQKIRDFAQKLCLELNTQVEQIQNELALTYSQAINKSLAPALEIMASEAINLNLYLAVNEKLNQVHIK